MQEYHSITLVYDLNLSPIKNQYKKVNYYMYKTYKNLVTPTKWLRLHPEPVVNVLTINPVAQIYYLLDRGVHNVEQNGEYGTGGIHPQRYPP